VEFEILVAGHIMDVHFAEKKMRVVRSEFFGTWMMICNSHLGPPVKSRTQHYS